MHLFYSIVFGFAVMTTAFPTPSPPANQGTDVISRSNKINPDDALQKIQTLFEDTCHETCLKVFPDEGNYHDKCMKICHPDM
ncbi:hypothetical protein F5Y04DRAFT_264145 [Hypomontagnella monticulosa]|nr:hypothetical protein F5Y04DRAFT_264145 [Hypomontagnella monticulosa]